MGGIAGHIQNPFEDKELTFFKLKKILSDASLGKLKGTEKIDGVQISLSFRGNQALYARNKTELKSLGKTFNDLINRDFPGGEKIKKIYIKAFKDFENTISQFSQEERKKIFEDGTIFYSCEIQSPLLKNTIKYNNNLIIVHHSGHVKIVPETKEIIDFNNETIEKLFDKFINNSSQEKNKFKLYRPQTFKLKPPTGDKDYKIAVAKIDKIMENAGLSNKDTIENFLSHHLNRFVGSRLPEVSKDIIEGVVQNILGNVKLAEYIPLKTPKELRLRISQIKKDSKRVLDKAIFPIEDAIHDFSVELLKGLKSNYITDNKKELQRIKKEVSNAIRTIQQSNNAEANEILSKQLSKLKNIDNINTTIEGFVFNFGNKTYKLTGNFAPINQILGLFKYGRGKKIPKMETLNNVEEGEKNNNGRTIAVIPGAFKPPHAGHFQMAKFIADKPEIDIVYILISPKERSGHSIENRISIDKDMSLKLWKLYSRDEPKIKPIISSKSSPVESVYDFMKRLEPEDRYVLVQGEKDKEDTRFKGAQEWADKNNYGIEIDIVNIPPMGKGISGSEMREIIAGDKKNKFFNFIPSFLSPKEKEIAWKIVNKQNNMFENIVKKAVYETVDKKKKTNECSSMSAGAVEGAPRKDKKKINTLIREKEDRYMINRKEFIEELKIREKIRECLSKNVPETRKNKFEENKIRNYVRQVLTEVEIEDDVPHHSTGINILEDLLKKIIPILENDYKALTTEESQRHSFRAHIINAVRNSIIPDASRETEDEEENGKFISISEDEPIGGEEEEIDVSIGGEEKFIDIEDKPKKSKEEEEEEKRENFGIDGEDSTGRNMAIKSFEGIENSILDSYNLLSNEEDKQLFYDYLLTNLKLYFDKFEDELNISLQEPTTDEYERQKKEEEEI